MATKHVDTQAQEAQNAIYCVALSLDAFLLNGVPFGVLQPASGDNFLDKLAGNLTRDLAALDSLVRHDSGLSPRTKETQNELQAKCLQLVDVVKDLKSYHMLSLQQVRSTVSDVVRLRNECVDLIQELEEGFQTQTPFYESRPAHSTEAMERFLSDLERLLSDAWHRGRHT